MTLLLCSLSLIGLLQGRWQIYYDDYYDDDGGHWDDDEDKFFEWYDGYVRRKAQKAQTKKELMFIAWHPSRYWDWCMSEDEKRDTEKLWA